MLPVPWKGSPQKENFVVELQKNWKSLINVALSEFVQKKGFKSYTELLAITEHRITAGQIEIHEFVFRGNEKTLCGLATKTWQMESTKENLEANKNGYGEGTFDFPLCHAEDCSDQW